MPPIARKSIEWATGLPMSLKLLVSRISTVVLANNRIEKRPLGKHEMQGVELELPPIILGRYGSDPSKKTVLVYGHYDVYSTV